MDGNRFHFCLLFCFLKGPPGLGLFRSAAKAADRHDPCRNCTASYVPQTNATVNHSCSTSLYCFAPAAARVLHSRVLKRCFDFWSRSLLPPGGISVMWPAHRVESSCSFRGLVISTGNPFFIMSGIFGL
uniref:Putative secreted protein n=1 Tax=Anopheles triannulatus TaxID=58253 RepID=A0A2M4B581_9DIPT